MSELAMFQNLTMSSLEISELVESRHDDVKRSIERLSERGVIQLPPLAEVKNHKGQTVKVYQVGKRDSYVVVAQLSPEFTARLVDRWQELESKSTVVLPDFSNPAIAARAWADEFEKKMIALQKIDADRPKVEFAERVRNLDGACTVSQFAKTIGMGRNTLYKRLRDDKILMINNLPYQRYLDNALFVVIESTPFTDSEGKTHPAFQTMITGKGQVWLEKKYRESQAA